MNTGQTILTMGALALLAIMVLRVSSDFLHTDSDLIENKLGLLGVSVAESVIEEATRLKFDENTLTKAVTDVDQLTYALSLGPEPGETFADFDDFDDYNGYARADSSMPSAIFNIETTVEYVSGIAPDIASPSRTWHKKITVVVSSKSMISAIQMSSVYSYWYFR